MSIAAADQSASIEKIRNLGRFCTFFTDQPGWNCKVNSKNIEDCIQIDDVCDGHRNQCYPDDSDEEEGCWLFKGNNLLKINSL